MKTAPPAQTFFRATKADAEEARERLGKYLPYRFRIEEDGKARRVRFQLVTDSIDERIPEHVALTVSRGGTRGIVLVRVLQIAKPPHILKRPGRT